jgi:hypothetical protein
MKIVDKFDPSDEAHVKWFSRMIEIADNIGNVNLLDEICKNPMRVPLSKDELLSWPMIHFCLAMKYCKFTLVPRS